MDLSLKQLEAPLSRIVASYELPDDLCRLMNQDNHTRFIKPEWLRELIYKLNSASMAWLCDLHRINLLNASPHRTRSMSFCDKIREARRNKTARTQKGWPWIFLAIYLACCIMLSVNMYFQYAHDANVAKLNKLLELQSSGQKLMFNFTQLKLEFEHKINETQRVLFKMGASHFEWTFIIEVIVVIFIQTINWFVIYPTRHYLYNWTMLSVKAVLDEAHETETRVQMIMEEMERFRSESSAFASAQLRRSRQDFMVAFDEKELTSAGHLGLIASETAAMMRRRAKKRHATLIDRLESVAMSGRLNPLNRNPLGRDQLALACFLCSVGFTVYAILLLWVVYSSVSRYLESYNKHVEHRSLADVLNSAGLCLFMWVSLQSAGFVVTLEVCNIVDDLNLNKRLRALILGVVRANEARFEAIKQMSNTSSSALAGLSLSCKCWPLQVSLRQKELEPQLVNSRLSARLAHDMELDLVTIIIQYRLTSRHATLIGSSIQMVIYMLIGWSFFVPAVLMIHGAYMCAEIRIRLIFLSSGCSLVGLVFLAPLAHLYDHRLALFQSVWKLVAQLSHFETVPEVSSHLDLGVNVSLLLLKRLLGKSQSLSDDLAFKILRLPVTYLNLARSFSYILVVTMAGSVLTTRLFGEGLASFMTDPFGLFDFHDGHQNESRRSQGN